MGIQRIWRRVLEVFSSSQRPTSKFDHPQEEPLFIAIPNDDPRMVRAYAEAAATADRFVELVQTRQGSTGCAKLRFRDPDLSERLGEDRFVFLWLASVAHHPDEGLLSGVFFEVPEPFAKWHQVGERIAFHASELFDWMVVDDGLLQGGFTLRVTREHLPAHERASFDKYIGVSSYAPLPS